MINKNFHTKNKNGADLKSLKNRDFETLRNEIIKTLEKSYSEQIARNIKLNIIKEQFNIINFNYTENQKAINDFIDDVAEISRFIKSSEWSGEDVMGIFFNERNFIVFCVKIHFALITSGV